MTDVSDQGSQAESVGQDNQEGDDSDDEQELSGCGVVTSFAWGPPGGKKKCARRYYRLVVTARF